MNLSSLHKWTERITYRQKVVGLTTGGIIVGLALLFAYTLRLIPILSVMTLRRA